MKWEISFNIPSHLEKSLLSLPPPSNTRRLSGNGNTQMLEVLYHFQYAPQSWREWQRVASIKVQLKERLQDITFKDFYEYENISNVYTISELGRYFPKFIKYPKPLYPSAKDEYLRNLTLYTQRLYYEGLLHFEAVVAMAMHFNSKIGTPYSIREVLKKAKSVYMMDKSKWRLKLTEEELQVAHSKGGTKRVQQKREEFEQKRDKALKLRGDGMVLKDIATHLEVSLITVKRWKLPKARR